MTRLMTSIRAIRLVTANPERLAAFYQALGFRIGRFVPISPEEMILLGLNGSGRRLSLHLGDQRLDLDQFEPAGRAYPADIVGCDVRFQHCALVTVNAALSWGLASKLGATAISCGGPVTLPAASGGVTAFKFRDPEGHPLEFLQFSSGCRTSRTASGLSGIDHTAISVADIPASLAFYRACGLTVGPATLNEGPTQAALDALSDVRVDVVPLVPQSSPPHLELLGYRSPRPLSVAPASANDIVATRTVWAAGENAVIRDPDDHLHQLTIWPEK